MRRGIRSPYEKVLNHVLFGAIVPDALILEAIGATVIIR
jgi:hypothetical protein